MSGANQGVDPSSGYIDGEEPPPPPSTAEIMMEAEQNHHDQTRLLERIEQNTCRQHHSVVTIQDFILLNPPVFRCSFEPLMPMIGFVTSSVSLRQPMLLPVIVCYSRHTFWKVL